jgi:hypothetical protein
MTTQLELTPIPADRAPRDAQPLREALADGEWHTARALRELGFTDRELRVIAEQNAGEFVTGNAGYKLASFATAAEIRECTDRLFSQARKMQQRAIHIQRAAHLRLNAPRRETLSIQ